MRHANVLPDSDAVNETDALVDSPEAGADVIVVSGAVVSAGGTGALTDHVVAAGEASVLPAASVARTERGSGAEGKGGEAGGGGRAAHGPPSVRQGDGRPHPGGV